MYKQIPAIQKAHGWYKLTKVITFKLKVSLKLSEIFTNGKMQHAAEKSAVAPLKNKATRPISEWAGWIPLRYWSSYNLKHMH